MKNKTGLKLRPLGKEFILIAESSPKVNFNKMISLNTTAAFLWQSVDGKEYSVDDLAKLLVDEYGIDMELALKDSATIAEKWIEVGIAEA